MFHRLWLQGKLLGKPSLRYQQYYHFLYGTVLQDFGIQDYHNINEIDMIDNRYNWIIWLYNMTHFLWFYLFVLNTRIKRFFHASKRRGGFMQQSIRLCQQSIVVFLGNPIPFQFPPPTTRNHLYFQYFLSTLLSFPNIYLNFTQPLLLVYLRQPHSCTSSVGFDWPEDGCRWFWIMRIRSSSLVTNCRSKYIPLTIFRHELVNGGMAWGR